MQLKFETKSSRVKGIAFHHTRPWVLTSLHSGLIQLWDYRIAALIDKYEEHEGPVRGIAFHPSQPLFVSGGDDYKIKLFNYKQKKCIFTLTGHIDYIRTVQFHHELPWIVSSSDDQTVRIWNYQSRSLMAILTGHSHYVMCAQFHPNKNLIVSCSLDQTIRIWDFTQLKNKNTSSTQSKSASNSSSTAQYSGDVETKNILEGHDRGVNWVAFHPTLNLIVSGADDRKIKIWKYTESKAWEHDSLYGHTNNVSCVLFHPKLDVIVSNSEDKTIRVWDINRRILLETYKRDQERFWILATHPSQNFIATGSDCGMFVFNLVRERIPYQVVGDNLYYINKKQLKHYNYKTQQDVVLKALDYTPQSFKYNVPTQIYVNTFDQSQINILIQFDNKEKQYYKYQLYTFEGNPDASNLKEKASKSQKFAYCLSAVFTGKGKLVKLLQDKTIKTYDYDTDATLKQIQNLNPMDKLFPGPLSKFIVSNEDSICFYDLTLKKIIGQYDGVEAANLKRVQWNNNYSMVALVCKKTILIMNKNFQKLCSINEKFNVKSLCWNQDDNVLIYNTVNHLKYALPNGDTGILLCQDQPIYIQKMEKDGIRVVNKEGNNYKVNLSNEEYIFKLAIYNKNPKQIKYLIENHKKLGNSIVAYLYKKNYSGIALNLVDDPSAKFSLAINSGNLEIAFKTSMMLKDPECFKKLGEEALRQGNHQLVEIAYQNLKAYDKLSFLYLITGNTNKLEKMLYIAQNRGDIQSRFQNALYLGDIHERIRILAEIGQLPLAYMMAVLHNITDMAAALKSSIEENIGNIDFDAINAQALIPPKPIIMDTTLSPQATMNWPQNNIEEEDLLTMRDIADEGNQNEDNHIEQVQDELDQVDINRFQDSLDINQNAQVKQNQGSTVVQEASKWGNADDDDLEFLDQDQDQQVQEVPQVQQNVSQTVSEFAQGQDQILLKNKNSQFAGVQVAIGNFDNAFQLLKKQIGAYEFKPFKQVFLQQYMANSLMVSSIPLVQPFDVRIRESAQPDQVFAVGSINQLQNELKQAYKFTSEYKLPEAIEKFNQILLQIPLLVLKNQQDKEDVLQLIRISLEYIVALNCETTKNNCPNDSLRQIELSAYLTMCNVQVSHRQLFLKASMVLAFKLKDFIYAAYFAKKILQLSELYPNSIGQDQVQKAKKVYQACEQQGKNEHKIIFEEKWLNDNDAVFKICAQTLTIVENKDAKRCPYCQARYKAQFDGQICNVCQVSKIGIETMGLKITNN